MLSRAHESVARYYIDIWHITFYFLVVQRYIHDFVSSVGARASCQARISTGSDRKVFQTNTGI